MTTDEATPSARLLALLGPVLQLVAEFSPARQRNAPAVEEIQQTLNQRFPILGQTVARIGTEVRLGIADGWLCNRGSPDARFSRLAKPSPKTFELSVDVVNMIGSAVDHSHPQGETTLGFAADPEHAGTCRFDGRPAGWVFLPPGSRHVPLVEGSRMHLIYFLPEGAVEWHGA
ncbi:MAG: DUF4863 family protein [Nannocystaceae bacterium]